MILIKLTALLIYPFFLFDDTHTQEIIYVNDLYFEAQGRYSASSPACENPGSALGTPWDIHPEAFPNRIKTS